MKDSEVRRALEQIGVFCDDFRDLQDKRNNVYTEHLQTYVADGEKALSAIKSLCDYVTDSGKIDVSEDLQEIHDFFQTVVFGIEKYIPNEQEILDFHQNITLGIENYIPNEQELNDDTRLHLFNTLAIRAGDIMIEIRRFWEWQEATGKGSTDEASSVIINEETEKKLKALFPNNELGKRQAKIFVREIKKIAESPKPSARKFAMLLAYSYRKTPALYNANTFTSLCQKLQEILNVKLMVYKNKPESLAKEWLQQMR